MPDQLRAFGTESPTRVNVMVTVPDDPDPYTLVMPRTVWFDRDPVDGHWLVWVSDPHEHGPEAEGDDIGAVVVHDPTVGAFLDILGQLLLSPRRFAEEPAFESLDTRAIGPPTRNRAISHAVCEGRAVPPDLVREHGLSDARGRKILQATLVWSEDERVQANAVPGRPSPMATPLEDVPGRLFGQRRTTRMDDVP